MFKEEHTRRYQQLLLSFFYSVKLISMMVVHDKHVKFRVLHV